MRTWCKPALPVAALLLAACATATGSATPGDADRAALVALVPDHATADCTGSLDFISSRRFEGRSSCGAVFQGAADSSLPIGTHCVFSSNEQSRRAGLLLSTGHFACSDGSRGTVAFEDILHSGSGSAVATAEDGRVVTLHYN